jgi:hypothetical protein
MLGFPSAFLEAHKPLHARHARSRGQLQPGEFNGGIAAREIERPGWMRSK